MSTTTARPAGDLASFLGGFFAGEGYLGHESAGEGRGATFTCRVALGASDARMCELLQAFLGVGNVRHYARRKVHFDDEVIWVVRSLSELVEIVVPFLDEHLPASYKQQQYLIWRAELMNYWHHRARRRRPCTVDGCDNPARAKGLCRQHYYTAFGR